MKRKTVMVTKLNERMIPVCEPLYLGREAALAEDAIRSGWISSSGSYLKEFEAKFSAYCGVKHGVAASSGTAALHLALRALEVKPGDEVIIPDFTMAAVLFSVLYCGATPVVVDAEPDTWNLDPKQVESKISKKTKVILAVHTYGHPCDMAPIMGLAKKYKLKVVEDAAEAHGAEYRGQKAGSLGDIGCFSFYANKIITTGEGGMVVTQNDELADRCRFYKNLCFPLKGPRIYQHEDLGWNYRMTNVQAALGLGQLENINQLIRRRREHAAYYHKRLSGLSVIQCPVEKSYAINVYWMYGVVLRTKGLSVDRDKICARLFKEGVDTRPFFRPMRRQRPFLRRGRAAGKYLVSDHLSNHGFYLPSGSGLSASDLDHVCSALEKAFGSDS